jgi:hypothetical protein
MTYRELKVLVGDRPFVWKDNYHTGKEWISQWSADGHIEYGLTDNPDSPIGITVPFNVCADLQIQNSFVLIDYFENTIGTSTECKCEKYSVFARGCRCGAIIPYEERNK